MRRLVAVVVGLAFLLLFLGWLLPSPEPPQVTSPASYREALHDYERALKEGTDGEREAALRRYREELEKWLEEERRRGAGR